jgi:hypothetical protein
VEEPIRGWEGGERIGRWWRRDYETVFFIAMKILYQTEVRFESNLWDYYDKLNKYRDKPDEKVFSRAADRTGIEAFRQVAIDMAKDCLSLGLIKGRMIGVDGSLIKSNSSAHKNEETEEYTDKDARLYLRFS